MSGTRHHVRAIYSSKSKVHISHTFSTPGTYTLTTNVTNIDFPSYEVNVTSIEVIEGINATIIDNDMYWVTNEEGSFCIQPHTGRLHVTHHATAKCIIMPSSLC